MGFGFGLDGWMFATVVPVLVTAGLVFVFVVMLLKAVLALRTWNKNNQSPRLDVAAAVVAKRTSVSRHYHGNAHHTTASTSYYATFQFESGDRLELAVSGPDYGMLAEGDKGTLTFQGTRFLSFKRD